MPLRRRYIAILEDNAERRMALEAMIQQHYGSHQCCFFLNSQAMIAWLPSHWNELAAISLDHDLEPVEAEGPWQDPGDGRQVADCIAAKSPVCRVIVHSTNVPAAIGMEEEMQRTGWQVRRITPYEDLLWVKEAWLPALKWAVPVY